MVWNSMLLSQWVIVQKIVGRLDGVADDTRARIIKQYEITRTPEGGWGMHGEGGPYVFMTALGYVALRLLGLPPEHPLCAPARDWLQSQPGGVCAIPSWGKFWLSMIGLYEYEGAQSDPARAVPFARLGAAASEQLLLPYAIHLSRYRVPVWASFQTRTRADSRRAPSRAVWRANMARSISRQHRHDIAPSDLHVRPSLPLRAIYDALVQYEKHPVRALREQGAARIASRASSTSRRRAAGRGCRRSTGCSIVWRSSPSAIRSSSRRCAAMESWKWEDEAEGIRYCGAHSTSWDTAFGMRAMLEAPAHVRGALDADRGAAARRTAGCATRRCRRSCPRATPPSGASRCAAAGASPTARIAGRCRDCTAEAMTALLEAHDVDGLIDDGARISDARLVEAARFILRRQNKRRRLRQLRVAPRLG